jgi:hypothetical protein
MEGPRFFVSSSLSSSSSHTQQIEDRATASRELLGRIQNPPAQVVSWDEEKRENGHQGAASKDKSKMRNQPHLPFFLSLIL